MNSNSRLSSLSFLAFLAIVVALWFSARDGDVLSITVLAVVGTLLLVGLGLAFALVVMYAATRIQQARSQADAATADALRSMAGAIAVQTRSLPMGMPGAGLQLPPGQSQYAPGLALPPMTSFKTIEGEVDEEIH